MTPVHIFNSITHIHRLLVNSIRVAGSSVLLPLTQVAVSSKLGLNGEVLILLFPLEIRCQLNSMPATLMGCSRMIYDIDGCVKNLSKEFFF